LAVEVEGRGVEADSDAFEGDGGDLGALGGVTPGDAQAVDGAAGGEGLVELDGGGEAEELVAVWGVA